MVVDYKDEEMSSFIIFPGEEGETSKTDVCMHDGFTSHYCD